MIGQISGRCILKIHAIAGPLALCTIAVFWASTVLTELFGSHDTIAATKMTILYGIGILIPAMATAGATGASLGKGRKSPMVADKSRRMKIIAANGLLILLPSATFLALRSLSGQFNVWFYTVQCLELVAGATIITLLSRNLQSGLALARRRKARTTALWALKHVAEIRVSYRKRRNQIFPGDCDPVNRPHD